MLTFLSTARKNNDAYYRDIEREEVPTKTTNESAIRWLIKHEFNGDAAQLSRIFVFASKAVRQPIVADNPETHLQYFMETIKDYINAEECIPANAIYPFDEDGSGDQNLISVAEMAGNIQKYAAECGDKITLHVDVSGGMRHISMIMLDVIRLLEYSGITIKHILYSNFKFGRKANYVEPVKNIYDPFQLISGVEEFVQFGSVKALKNYYDNQDQNALSTKLKNLIGTMENFAEQVKLCHYGAFELAIRQLHDAVNDFKPDENNAQDLLMARLIDRIREMYADTIKNRTVDDVELIRWCVKNDYVQQALTLYTERVPEYLGERGLIVMSKEEYAKLSARVESKATYNLWFYLLNHYFDYLRKNYVDNRQDFPQYASFVDTETDCGDNYYKMIKAACVAINKKNFNYDVWYECLKKELQASNVDEPRLRTQLKLLSNLKMELRPLLNLDDPYLDPIRKIIDDLRPELESKPKAYERFKRLINYLKDDILDETLKEYFPRVEKSSQTKFSQTESLKKMIDVKIFKPAFDEDKFFKIMNRYYRLKKERNQSNHARADSGEFLSASELKKFILAGLDELSEVSRSQ